VLSGRTPQVSTDQSGVPSDWPSMAPSDAPVSVLSDQPSLLPSDTPSSVPSDLPSLSPSGSPSALRSDWPSLVPLDVSVKDLVPSAELGGQSSEASPTAVPTALSCNSDPDKRASAILLELVRSGIDMELPLSTKTYYWLIGEEVDCPETRNIVQRFTMGTLYFGLTGWNCTSEANESCFLSIDDECSWVGVSCNNNGQVTSLRLDDLELSGNLPDLSHLSMLVELDMDSNTLSGTLPTWIGELPYLEIVDFDSNNLTGTIPTEIGNASKLRVIDLDGNQLSGSIPEEVGSLMNLYFLQLDFNLLTGSIPISLVDIPTLEYLSIIGNNFTDPLVIEFCNRQLELFANCDMCAVAECCTACLTLP
jgi:Leucine-rich repeat (LRR) protein